LKQNITQQSLAQESGVSLSTLKNIEKGEIGSFDSLLRLLRTLGLLEVLLPLVEEERLSPNEYYQMVQSANNKQRKRASGTIKTNNKEAAEW
jgi:transcriptional regulator with XRE-family HTH domain